MCCEDITNEHGAKVLKKYLENKRIFLSWGTAIPNTKAF